MKYVLRIGYLRNILVVSIIIAVALPICTFLFIFPLFTGMLVNNTEDDSVRLASHISTMLLGDQTELSLKSLTVETLEDANLITKQFGLMKLKIFSKSGEIIFSTDSKDIGQFNKTRYFHEVVAKGEAYKKIVKKGSSALDEQSVTADVVETYVPIINNDKVIGAFEIYYDITDRKVALDKLVSISQIVLSILAFSLLSAIIIVLINAGKNIFQREQAEDHLRRVEQRELVGEWALGLVQEIRNPLAGIKATMEVLCDEIDIPEDLRAIVLQAETAIKLIEALLKNLLNFTKPHKLHLSNLEINDFLDKTIVFFLKDPIFSFTPSIKVSKHFNENLPILRADPLQLQGVFLNLFSNAIEAMPEGGTLEIKTAFDETDNVIQIEISDTGKGIDSGRKDDVFKPFFTTKSSKSGLGLAIARRIVEQHGGVISVKSDPGKRTMFNVNLPLITSSDEETDGISAK